MIGGSVGLSGTFFNNPIDLCDSVTLVITCSESVSLFESDTLIFYVKYYQRLLGFFTGKVLPDVGSWIRAAISNRRLQWEVAFRKTLPIFILAGEPGCHTLRSALGT